jgi:hypothetical protein
MSQKTVIPTYDDRYKDSIIGRSLSQKQAAGRIGISMTTMRIWRLKKKGPPYTKLGRRLFYSEDDLNAWLLDKRVAE